MTIKKREPMTPRESYYIEKAVTMLGGQTATARRFGLSQTTVRTWFKRDHTVPPRIALDLEAATNYLVTREQMCKLFQDPRIVDDDRQKEIKHKFKQDLSLDVAAA